MIGGARRWAQAAGQRAATALRTAVGIAAAVLAVLWGRCGYVSGYLAGRLVAIALWWWLAALRGYKDGL